MLNDTKVNAIHVDNSCSLLDNATDRDLHHGRLRNLLAGIITMAFLKNTGPSIYLRVPRTVKNPKDVKQYTPKELVDWARKNGEKVSANRPKGQPSGAAQKSAQEANHG